MLQLNHITIYHRKDDRTLIRDFSFTPHEGEKAAFIGEEGNGKSTLLALIHDPSLIESYADVTGSISKGGCITGYLPQQLPAEYADMTFWEFLYSADDLSSSPDGPSIPLVNRLAAEFGLSERITNDEIPLGKMSGGEKIKVQLIRILSGEPDVLLLDEPSNDLDLGTLVWLEEFIRETPKTVLYISHDEVLLENTADCIVHIEQIMRRTEPKVTVSRTGYAEYVERRTGMLEKSEVIANKEKAELDKKMERYRKIYDRVRVAQRNNSRQDPATGRLLKKKMHSVKSMGRRFEKEKENLAKKIDSEEAIMIDFPEISVPHGKVILDLNLPVLYTGGNEHPEKDAEILAENLRFTLYGGDKLVITGRNGCGKTTLMREIARRLLPRTDLHTVYMPQHYEDEMPQEKTPVEYLSETGDRSEDIRHRTYLGSIKFTAAEMEHPIASLSGGQRAKLYFLKMILSGADTLLLDEPTRNLSPMSNPVIRRILQNYGGTVIAVSHDRKFIDEVAETEYQMD
ncbi:MAG: ABC-F family ATP-binding cassette domain-containing protein [Clostridia bacterium]|nr:ABC-F family ATP-binding cassette domain-containing protein [Clostridia bacterium]